MLKQFSFVFLDFSEFNNKQLCQFYCLLVLLLHQCLLRDCLPAQNLGFIFFFLCFKNPDLPFPPLPQGSTFTFCCPPLSTFDNLHSSTTTGFSYCEMCVTWNPLIEISNHANIFFICYQDTPTQIWTPRHFVESQACLTQEYSLMFDSIF